MKILIDSTAYKQDKTHMPIHNILIGKLMRFNSINIRLFKN